MARISKEEAAKREALLKKKARRKADIAKWKPKGEDQILIEHDKKIFKVHFDKIFGYENLGQYNRFIIEKTSYFNQLDVITSYVNYFMNRYDPENDLAIAYLKIKVEMDKYRVFTEENSAELIDFIYSVMFHDRMIAKITKLVDDNYLDDIETGDENDKYKLYSKQYLESLEFSNEHVKVMLRISFAMKMMSPIILHYVYLNVIKLDQDNDLLYQFYKRLFKILNRTENGEINIYNKLFTYIKAKVLDNHVHNQTTYDQRLIMGVDDYQVIKHFFRKVIISENMVKYKFNEHYDIKKKKYKENVIGLNKTIIKYQLYYFLKVKYAKNITEVTNIKNAEGLSGVDKLEMNMCKFDEGMAVLGEINAETTYENIVEDAHIYASREEIEYYIDHTALNEFQIILIRAYFASCFGNIKDIDNLTRFQFYHLLVILKKYLVMKEGYNPDRFHGEECPLAYMLVGNMSGKLNNRIIRNSKFNATLEENERYQYLYDVRYKYLLEVRPEELQRTLSTFLNTPFSYVSYEAPELLDKEIEYDEYDVSNQLAELLVEF